MSHPFQYNQSRIIPASILGGCAWVVMGKLGPVISGTFINWPATLAGGICTISALVIIANTCGFIANALDLLAASTPKGNKGNAKWASYRSLRKDILHSGWAPYWGVFAKGNFSLGKPIFADYASNAVTFGTAGSGKGIGVVLPTCLAIRKSKILPDFKGVNSCCLKEPLEARGEKFRMLNIGGMQTNILGEGDFYNPLNIISDNFKRSGGIQNITSDCEELSLQLYEESESGSNKDDKYWHNGSCDFIGYSIQQCILVHGDKATLGTVNQLLNHREQLLKEALWAAGRLEDKDGHFLPPMPLEDSPWVNCHDPEDVKNYIAYFRAKANSIADLLLTIDSKTADSFLTGARQSLAPYNITTHAHKVLSKSTFRFGNMKEGNSPMTVAIIIDSSRMETQSKIASLLQWCALTELKRHKNKHRPVYFIADECTNFKIHNLPSLQTWGREYGIRWHGFIQSLSAYRTTYGKEAVNILLSETEIKQFLPSQREPETLELIERLLGEQSIITKNHNGNYEQFGVHGFNYQEEAKPLMRAEEIRRTDKTILFIRKNRPILTTLPPIAGIVPWRKQIGINPFYDKPFLKRVTLRLGHRKGNPILRLYKRLINVLHHTKSKEELS